MQRIFIGKKPKRAFEKKFLSIEKERGCTKEIKTLK